MNPKQFDRRSFMHSAGAASALVGCHAIACESAAAAKPNDESRENLYLIADEKTGDFLSVFDGEVWFMGRPRNSKETFYKYKDAWMAFRKELTAQSMSKVWRFKDGYIRIYFPRGKDRRGIDVVVPNPDIREYYLSADYSTIPARLVLTPEPTEYSRWEVTAVENPQTVFSSPRVGEKYVRNLNGGKQDAWLARSETQFLRESGTLWGLNPALLSFEEKARFHWRSHDPADNTGK